MPLGLVAWSIGRTLNLIGNPLRGLVGTLRIANRQLSKSDYRGTHPYAHVYVLSVTDCLSYIKRDVVNASPNGSCYRLFLDDVALWPASGSLYLRFERPSHSWTVYTSSRLEGTRVYSNRSCLLRCARNQL